ncbi:N-ethylmaleimide reductase [Chitinivorax tropicus]|uniref:N-ethylmaleimide reductase n=1 Tax=Chitinivorax tropicus TaxID=714531 RepID=A0A840MBV8_9PROT|nr:alkene reductase [Chitinivorax tropicus]MBB5016814.1 N-ethylmaleimide reductase [Chitinivorax tropicus]
MKQSVLFSPIRVGAVTLANRIIMAPLTRSRAGQPGDVPRALNVEYYRQRASAGLIITEATQISQQGQGYAWTPGIYTDAQQAGWQSVVEAAHGAGGKIAMQLWHVGRISHHLLQPGQAQPVAPSAIQAPNSMSFVVLPDGTPANVPCDLPRALSTEEIGHIVKQYADSTRRSKQAGFDLVEIHAANGYLLNQFLATGTNQRQDQYGGTIENRARFLLEVVDAAIAEMGADRIGVRLSPWGLFGDIDDTEPAEMALYLADQLNQRKIAYLHFNEPTWTNGPNYPAGFRESIRQAFQGVILYCGGYQADSADKLVSAGVADGVAFGRLYIANPDLVARFAAGAVLNEPDASTFYGGEEQGYTDYPFLTSQAAATV